MENRKKSGPMSNGDSGFCSSSIEYESETANISNNENHSILQAFKPDENGDKYVF